jgi:uncharacterized protein YqiB (DUF1249 family)
MSRLERTGVRCDNNLAVKYCPACADSMAEEASVRMSHSIAEHRARNPMWYFEQNYRLLTALLDTWGLPQGGGVELDHGSSRFRVKVLESTRYTMLLGLCHELSDVTSYVDDFSLKVRIYLDAKLAEVVCYQGVHRLQPRYDYPNAAMYHPDEKRQANLILYDWLSSYARLNFSNIENTVYT